MEIKLIATDMDGTFLNDKKEYDEKKFKDILEKCERYDIQFVVASGNQYRQIIKSFPEDHHRMTFIAENGAHSVHKGKTLHEHFQDPEEITDLIAFIEEAFPETLIMLSGEHSAYMREDTPKEWVERLRHYMPVVSFEKSLLPLPKDHFYKVTLLFPEDEEQTHRMVSAIQERYKEGNLHPTSSGFGCIDVISKGLDKGWALQTILTDWNLTSENLMAFGDGGNDIEMLKLAKHAFAMGNAQEPVKEVASAIIESNNESGVLKTIEKYLKDLEVNHD